MPKSHAPYPAEFHQRDSPWKAVKSTYQAFYYPFIHLKDDSWLKLQRYTGTSLSA